jgi:predicted heme/steroid binding protein
MKRIAAIAISLLAFFAFGCAGSAQEAAAQTPEATEVVAIMGVVPNDTATPRLTPTQAPITPVPTAPPAQTPSAANGTLALTLEQLKQYDGKNGNPAYIAVDGVLYDVSEVRQWKNGSHEGYSAGKDLTDAIIGKSPHGTSVLDGVPVVGKLVAG